MVTGFCGQCRQGCACRAGLAQHSRSHRLYRVDPGNPRRPGCPLPEPCIWLGGHVARKHLAIGHVCNGTPIVHVKHENAWKHAVIAVGRCAQHQIVCRFTVTDRRRDPTRLWMSAPISGASAMANWLSLVTGSTPKENGGGGIRTHERLRVDGFQDRCLQPLGHPSTPLCCPRGP